LKNEDAEAYFFSTGSALNIISLSLVTSSYNSVIVSSKSHTLNHATGGLEKFIGARFNIFN
jgi:threonine aldolase